MALMYLKSMVSIRTVIKLSNPEWRLGGGIEIDYLRSVFNLCKSLNSFGFPYETGKLDQVTGPTDRDVLLFATLRYVQIILYLTDSPPNSPAPTNNCSYQLFDLVSDKYVENATAVYSSTDKILELSNVEEDRGYALKIDGEEMAKFVINTAHFNDSYTGNITVGGKFARNITG